MKLGFAALMSTYVASRVLGKRIGVDTCVVLLQAALRSKVSRERMGKEVNGALRCTRCVHFACVLWFVPLIRVTRPGKNPLLAMELIYKYGLDAVIFEPPAEMMAKHPGAIETPASGQPCVETAFR